MELTAILAYYRMRSEGFLFLSGVYGRFAWQAWGIVAACARRWIEGWRFAWQAWGMVDDVCVKRMPDVHFAWHAWGSGRVPALGKALEGGSAWQA